MSGDRYPVVIAIPAKNEAELLPLCLAALNAQTGVRPADVAVIVSCNNCTDDSAALVRHAAAVAPFALHAIEVSLPPPIAHAGGARRQAMDAARACCRADGMLLTTDADSVPDTDWLAATMAAFQGTIAAVAGRVSTDWAELSKFPADVLDIGAREWDYQLLSAELEAMADPQAHDPWPRHNQRCGANMAIRADWYDRIGGLPVLRTGEDGAMFAAVQAQDGPIRHAPGSHVTVSARLVGRAQGGMADALTARHGDAYLCDDLLEPADDLLRRNRWRHEARAAFSTGSLGEWAASVGIDAAAGAAAAASHYFGAAWQELEGRDNLLMKRRLRATDLDRERGRVRQLIEHLRTEELTDAA